MTGKKIWDFHCSAFFFQMSGRSRILIFFGFCASEGVEQTPVLRFGIVADNFFESKKTGTAERTRRGFLLQKYHRVDLPANAGDLRLRYDLPQFRLWRSLFQEVCSEPATRPHSLPAPAGHEPAGMPDRMAGDRSFIRGIGSEVLASVRVMEEYHFVFCIQRFPIAALEEKRKADRKAEPSRPISGIAHIPAPGFFCRFGDVPLQRLLEHSPQTVLIFRHLPVPFRYDRSIWQGTSTAVHAAPLPHWTGDPVTDAERVHQEYDALVFAVFESEIVMRHFDLRTGKEDAQEKVWRISLPHRSGKEENAPETRAAKVPVPGFSPDMRIVFPPEHSGRTGGMESPGAIPADAVERYRIPVENTGRMLHFRRLGRLTCSAECLPEIRKKSRNAGISPSGTPLRIAADDCSNDFWGKIRSSAAEKNPAREGLVEDPGYSRVRNGSQGRARYVRHSSGIWKTVWTQCRQNPELCFPVPEKLRDRIPGRQWGPAVADFE